MNLHLGRPTDLGVTPGVNSLGYRLDQLVHRIFKWPGTEPNIRVVLWMRESIKQQLQRSLRET